MKGNLITKISMVLIVLFICSSILPTNNAIQIVQASEREIRVGLYFGSTARANVTLSTDVNTYLKLTDGTETYTVGQYGGNLNIGVNRTGTKNVLPVFSSNDLQAVQQQISDLKGIGFNPILVYDIMWYAVVEPNQYSAISQVIPGLSNNTMPITGFVEATVTGIGPVFYYRQLDARHGLQIHSEGEFIRLYNSNSQRYRGFIEINMISYNFRVINQLNLELYLRGVVPYEMSPSWNVEALKAQAVAARTYAIRNWNKFSSQNFNVCNTVNSQVYHGFSASYETTNVLNAINGTKGEIIVANGIAIDAVYHSHSGGHTENSENVWGGTLSYLRGKPDPFSTRSGSALDSWRYNTVITGVDAFGRQGFKDKLVSANHIPSNFVISDVTLTKMSSNGTSTRVTSMTIHATDGRKVTLNNTQIWNLLYPTSTSIPTSERFWSRMFDVELDAVYSLIETNGQSHSVSNINSQRVLNTNGTVTDLQGSSNLYVLDSDGKVTQVSAVPTRVNFKGSGWGHGVGMSQWGAKRMGDEGYKYDEILKYYYTGVTIRAN